MEQSSSSPPQPRPTNATISHRPSAQPRGQMLALNAHFVISSAAPTALILLSVALLKEIMSSIRYYVSNKLPLNIHAICTNNSACLLLGPSVSVPDHRRTWFRILLFVQSRNCKLCARFFSAVLMSFSVSSLSRTIFLRICHSHATEGD